jgi:hypothetical protein
MTFPSRSDTASLSQMRSSATLIAEVAEVFLHIVTE